MLNGDAERLMTGLGIDHWPFSVDTFHHPQQSVLNRQSGHRQTACMRNISAPHRSQRTFSDAPLDAARGDTPPGARPQPGSEEGAGRLGAAAVLLGSGIAAIIRRRRNRLRTLDLAGAKA